MKILPVVKSNNYMLPLAERCKSSWDYWHPDIPMHIVNLEQWQPYTDFLHQTPKYGNQPMAIGLFYAILKMMTEGYDLLIHIDADTVITGRCDEMFTDDYDIGVSKCWYHDPDPPYYNAGIWTSRDLDFIKDFYYAHNLPIEDNNLFMIVESWYGSIYSKNKTIKVLDEHGSGVWYNQCSGAWWGRLKIIDNELWTVDDIDSRRIKILHWASGCKANEVKMSCSLFSDEVKQWLNKITKSTDFTDYDGKDYGDFLTRTYKL